MSEQFKEQGGSATMDPNPLRRWLSSVLINRVLSPARQAKRRARFERQRCKAAARHRLEYFHQVDDSYSHLAVQLLQPLVERYDIELVCHLVSGPSGKNAAEPALMSRYSVYDAHCIAPNYGLSFPEQQSAPPDSSLVEQALAILAAQNPLDYASCAVQVGEALWSGDKANLTSLAIQFGSASTEASAACLKAGNARRAQLGHYAGAMFYYAGEWYWGVDRLHYLETRLHQLGAQRKAQEGPLAPRPEIVGGPLKDNGSLQLEVFFSLRSPYSAISFDRTLKLARETGIELVLRPVLPMVMRGVPVTLKKGLYIFADAAREARASGTAFGRFCDPIGEPIRRCYSLYPWACEQGKGADLLSSFMGCAFAEGINTSSNRGLQRVVEKAGLDWQQAQKVLGKSGWQAILEENRQAMYGAGLWGVPSFRLVDTGAGERSEQLAALWGQDRLWLIAQQIQSRLALNNRHNSEDKDG